MGKFFNKTNLFEGLSPEEAVAVYWRLIDKCQVLPGTVDEDVKFDVEVAHFRLCRSRGCVNEALVSAPWGTIGQVAIPLYAHLEQKTVAEVAEHALGAVLQHELVAVFPHQGGGELRDVTRFSGYDVGPGEFAVGLDQENNRILEGRKFHKWGTTHYPAYGSVHFAPAAWTREACVIMDERFEEILGAHMAKLQKIKELFEFVQRHHGTGYYNLLPGQDRWRFSGDTFNGGYGIWMSPETAYGRGLLQEWADHYGYEETV